MSQLSTWRIKLPSQSLGIEIPFIADEALLGVSTRDEQGNTSSNQKLPGQADPQNNNKKDKANKYLIANSLEREIYCDYCSPQRLT